MRFWNIIVPLLQLALAAISIYFYTRPCKPSLPRHPRCQRQVKAHLHGGENRSKLVGFKEQKLVLKHVVELTSFQNHEIGPRDEWHTQLSKIILLKGTLVEARRVGVVTLRLIYVCLYPSLISLSNPRIDSKKYASAYNQHFTCSLRPRKLTL